MWCRPMCFEYRGRVFDSAYDAAEFLWRNRGNLGELGQRAMDLMAARMDRSYDSPSDLWWRTHNGGPGSYERLPVHLLAGVLTDEPELFEKYGLYEMGDERCPRGSFAGVPAPPAPDAIPVGVHRRRREDAAGRALSRPPPGFRFADVLSSTAGWVTMTPDDAGYVGDAAGGSGIPDPESSPEDKKGGESKKPKGRDGRIARQYLLDPATVNLIDQVRLATSKSCPEVLSDAIRVYARIYVVSDAPSLRDLAAERDPEKIRAVLSEVGSQRPLVEAESGPSGTCGTSEAESPANSAEGASTGKAPVNGEDPWIYETCRECGRLSACHRRPLRWGGHYFICERCEGRLP